MGLFTDEKFNSLEDLFVCTIKDLYDAENQLVEALPKMSEAAENPQLKQAFDKHLKETRNHVNRLEKIFQAIEVEAERKTCAAMKGLITEGEEMVKAKGNASVRDAGLIAAAQRVEHYEMAGYGAARSFAESLGHTDVARLLQETLDEEGQADKTLTSIAESVVNAQAQNA